MTTNFQCPSCSADLQFESGDSGFQNCPACGGKIIVPSEVFQHTAPEDAGEFALAERKNLKITEIQKELQEGRKINAVKIFRETFGTDLETSKDYVEAIERGEYIDVSDLTIESNYVPTPTQNRTSLNNTGKQKPIPSPAMRIFLRFALLALTAYLLYNLFYVS